MLAKWLEQDDELRSMKKWLYEKDSDGNDKNMKIYNDMKASSKEAFPDYYREVE